jgi:hypothetical protein
MHPNSVFMYTNLRGRAGFGLTGDRNRAKMRGKIPASHFISVKLPEIIAHLCAVFTKMTAKNASADVPEFGKIRNEPIAPS